MSERMEALQAALAEDRVPDTWTAKAYPSKRTLGLWYYLTLLPKVDSLCQLTPKLTVRIGVDLDGPQRLRCELKVTTRCVRRDLEITTLTNRLTFLKRSVFTFRRLEKRVFTSSGRT